MTRIAGPGVPPMTTDLRAKCRGIDGDVFYPERYDPVPVAAARKVCTGCEVRADCLLWALRHEPEGIFGGYSPAERAAMGGVYNGHAKVEVAA